MSENNNIELAVILTKKEMTMIGSFVKRASVIPYVECIYLLPLFKEVTNKKIVRVVAILNAEQYYNELLNDDVGYQVTDAKKELTEIINSYTDSGRLEFYDAWSGNYKLPLRSLADINSMLSLVNGTVLFDRFGEKTASREQAYEVLVNCGLYHATNVLPIKIRKEYNWHEVSKNEELAKCQILDITGEAKERVFNKNLAKANNFIRKFNFYRALEVAEALGKSISEKDECAIMYKSFVCRPHFFWQNVLDTERLKPELRYYINVSSKKNEACCELSDYISFFKYYKRDKDGNIIGKRIHNYCMVMVTDGNYIYQWIKNNEQGIEKLTITYKIDNYRMKTCNFVLKTNSIEQFIMMGDGSGTWIELPFGNYNNYNIENKILYEDSYYSLVDTLNDKHDEGALPSYITEEVIGKIGLVFRPPMNRIMKDTEKRDINYQKRRKKR